MVSLNSLPYFRTVKNKTHYFLAKFLRRKFYPKLRQVLPDHYLLNQDPRFYLDFIRKKSKAYPHFLKFDVEKFYPSVNHKVLLSKIVEIYEKLLGFPPPSRYPRLHLGGVVSPSPKPHLQGVLPPRKRLSRRFTRHLKTTLPQFLSQSPFPNFGLPVGSSLSYILAGIFLLSLDLKLKQQKIPFLRFNDDYLVFAKNAKTAQGIFKELVITTLSELKLSVNPTKVSSGKFHKDKVCFLGFCYFAGYFTIEDKRIKNFKRKITKITHPKKNKPVKATIKLLNNQILGFGHYYKLASAKQDFSKLDAFTRKRLRIYLVQTARRPILGNLYLTNRELYDLELKSLSEIFEKHQNKLKKTKQSQSKTGQKQPPRLHHYKRDFLHPIKEKRLFEILEEITERLERIETRLRKIEKKVE